MIDTDDIKQPNQQTQAWPVFIAASKTRPRRYKWQDMCFCHVNEFVLLFCEDVGLCVGVCLYDDDKPAHLTAIWHRVDNTAGQEQRFIPCNPSWWMPLPMSPPERPDGS